MELHFHYFQASLRDRFWPPYFSLSIKDFVVWQTYPQVLDYYFTPTTCFSISPSGVHKDLVDLQSDTGQWTQESFLTFKLENAKPF